jgi:hypothetical protein
MYCLFIGSRRLKLISISGLSSPIFFKGITLKMLLIKIRNKNNDKDKNYKGTVVRRKYKIEEESEIRK